MRALKQYLAFAALSAGVPLLVLASAAVFLVAIFGGPWDLRLFAAVGGVAALLVLVYWIPFATLLGAPIFVILRRTQLRGSVSATIAIALCVAGAALLGRQSAQCVSSNWERLSILRRLSPSDASSFRRVRTLDDDFDDDRSFFALSNYCPHWYEYTERGEVKHVSVHDEHVSYGRGPVR